MENNRQIGTKGELIATKYIKGLAYEIVINNYRIKIGEIDIIALHKGVLVFIEVKLRKSLKYGYPIESIDSRKIKTIKTVANEYIRTKGLWDYPVRFDVVEIFLNEKDEFKVNLIENAF